MSAPRQQGQKSPTVSTFAVIVCLLRIFSLGKSEFAFTHHHTTLSWFKTATDHHKHLAPSPAEARSVPVFFHYSASQQDLFRGSQPEARVASSRDRSRNGATCALQGVGNIPRLKGRGRSMTSAAPSPHESLGRDGVPQERRSDRDGVASTAGTITKAKPKTAQEWGTAATGGSGSNVYPSVTLKLAMDRNGAVDDLSDGPKRFTCQDSLDAVHRIRRDCSAVLVGVGTVVRDDPSLTHVLGLSLLLPREPEHRSNDDGEKVRRVQLDEGRKQPTRVVLDRSLRMPGVANCKILGDGNASLIFYSTGSEQGKTRACAFSEQVEASGAPVEFVGLPPDATDGGVRLVDVLEAMTQRGMEHVLVEGGPTTARLFLSEGLVDRAIIVRAPMEFDRPVPSNMDSDTLRRAGLELVGRTRWGDDDVECWTRPTLGWPCGGVGSWP